jgi:DNA anti-recombination protein RmuC
VEQEAGNLKQHFTQLSGAQVSSDKKINDLNGQVRTKVGGLAQDLGNLKQQLAQAKQEAEQLGSLLSVCDQNW